MPQPPASCVMNLAFGGVILLEFKVFIVLSERLGNLFIEYLDS